MPKPMLVWFNEFKFVRHALYGTAVFLFVVTHFVRVSGRNSGCAPPDQQHDRRVISAIPWHNVCLCVLALECNT